MSLSMLNRLEAWLLGLASGCVVVGVVSMGLFSKQYQNRIYEGVYIDGVNVGGMTLAEAKAALPVDDPPLETTIKISVDDIYIASSSSELGLHLDYEAALNSALQHGKDGWWPQQLIKALDARFRPVLLTSQLSFNQAAVEQLVNELASQVDIAPVEAAASLKMSQNANSLVINPGSLGRSLEKTTTEKMVLAEAGSLSPSLTAPVASVGAELNQDELLAARDRARKFVGKRLVLESLDSTIRLEDQDLVALLAFPDGWSNSKLVELLTEWKSTLDRPPQDAVFSYDPETLAVKEFVPSRDGLTINREDTTQAIISTLTQFEVEKTSDELTTKLAFQTQPPTLSLEATNDLGIKELIGFGESEYDHSIPSRIHNVSLTTSRISNHIIKPGEEFSFNKALGDVSAATGFKPAYVIMNGQTVLGDGGGVCQVSTTLFRAVLDAGLKVTKRRPHSYRVSYYELNSKPGVDATVYAGDVDLRFVNDTEQHILIHAEADSKNLYMKVELYGTSDGRSTEIVNHRTWDFRPAPPAVYIPDPTLAPGQLKQIDWAASGIKASFTNVIKDKDGQIIREDTYNSNYIPWSAKYLQGVTQ